MRYSTGSSWAWLTNAILPVNTYPDYTIVVPYRLQQGSIKNF